MNGIIKGGIVKDRDGNVWLVTKVHEIRWQGYSDWRYDGIGLGIDDKAWVNNNRVREATVIRHSTGAEWVLHELGRPDLITPYV